MENYLNTFNLFTQEDIAELVALGTYKTIKKGDYFFRGDAVCQKVAFVYAGIFRHFYHLDSGEEITYCFTYQDNFVTAYSSFVSNKKTDEHIQALTDGSLFVIPKIEMERLINTKSNWMAFSRKIADKQYIKRENRILLLQKETAKIKYEYLLKHNPEYLQTIPLQHLASFIGVSPRHLSRLRKELIF